MRRTLYPHHAVGLEPLTWLGKWEVRGDRGLERSALACTTLFPAAKRFLTSASSTGTFLKRHNPNKPPAISLDEAATLIQAGQCHVWLVCRRSVAASALTNPPSPNRPQRLPGTQGAEHGAAHPDGAGGGADPAGGKGAPRACGQGHSVRVPRPLCAAGHLSRASGRAARQGQLSAGIGWGCGRHSAQGMAAQRAGDGCTPPLWRLLQFI